MTNEQWKERMDKLTADAAREQRAKADAADQVSAARTDLEVVTRDSRQKSADDLQAAELELANARLEAEALIEAAQLARDKKVKDIKIQAEKTARNAKSALDLANTKHEQASTRWEKTSTKIVEHLSQGGKMGAPLPPRGRPVVDAPQA